MKVDIKSNRLLEMKVFKGDLTADRRSPPAGDDITDQLTSGPESLVQTHQRTSAPLTGSWMGSNIQGPQIQLVHESDLTIL